MATHRLLERGRLDHALDHGLVLRGIVMGHATLLQPSWAAGRHGHILYLAIEVLIGRLRDLAALDVLDGDGIYLAALLVGYALICGF